MTFPSDVEDEIGRLRGALECGSIRDSPHKFSNLVELSRLLTRRVGGDHADNIECALAFADEALRISEARREFWQWVDAQLLIADLLRRRVMGNKHENLARARDICRPLKSMVTREQDIQRWKVFQVTLGRILADLLPIDVNIEGDQAVNYLVTVLPEIDRNAEPEIFGDVNEALATALYERREGSKSENLNLAEHAALIAIDVRDTLGLRVNAARAKLLLGKILYDASTWWLGRRTRRAYGMRLRDAERYLNEAAQILTTDAFSRDAYEIWSLLAWIACAYREWDDASNRWCRAIDAADLMFESSFTEMGRRVDVASTATAYFELAACQLQCGKWNDSLLYAERGRARLLAESLSIQTFIQSGSSEEAQAIAVLSHQIATLEAKSLSLEKFSGAQSLTESLRSARERLRLLITASSNINDLHRLASIDDAFATVPENGAIVGFLLTDLTSAVYILKSGHRELTKEHVIILEQSQRSIITEILEWWIGSSHLIRPAFDPELDRKLDHVARLLGLVHDNAHQLDPEAITTLLGEGPIRILADHLTQLGVFTGAPVVVIPHSGMSLLPIHAAQWNQDGARMRFAELFRISYAPSIAVLYAKNDTQVGIARIQSTLLLTDPSRDLRFAEAEGSVIAALAAGSVVTLAGNEGTTETFVSYCQGKTRIHLACHGSFDADHPYASGLQLAQGTVLKLSEIPILLKLQECRLIVLSACESGVTEAALAPDEAIGLPSALLAAGAAGVVCAIWKADDLAAMFLMQRFYIGLFVDKLSPPEALHVGQAWLREATNAQLYEVCIQSEKLLKSRSDRHAVTFKRLARKYAPPTPPDHTPFSNAFFWAPFVYTGALV